MNLYAILFYLLGAQIIFATVLAVTRRNVVHGVIYLVISFFGSGMLFYLLGAPFLGALEIIIYAGAIMILFLFIVMMLRVEQPRGNLFSARQWIPAAALGVLFFALAGLLVVGNPGGHRPMAAVSSSPAAFGKYLFQKHWLAIEITSLLLLIALLAAFILGRKRGDETSGRRTEAQL
jgi:NADH-quinone oxidoreductase subunit J